MAFYLRKLLMLIRNSWKPTNFSLNQPPLPSHLWQTLASIGIFATRRRQRGGNHLRQRSNLTIRPIFNFKRTLSETFSKVKRVNYGKQLIEGHTSLKTTTLPRVNEAQLGPRNLNNLVMVKTLVLYRLRLHPNAWFQN